MILTAIVRADDHYSDLQFLVELREFDPWPLDANEVVTSSAGYQRVICRG
jgi:hypothetical protein